MKSKAFAILKYVALFAVGLVLLWLAFRKEDLSEVWEKMRVADPFWLAASILIAIMAFISRAVRWIMLMEPLGYKPSLKNTLYALLLGYFANLAIPRIGEITRCGALTKVENVPFNGLLGTVIVERVIDLIMLFFTMMIVALLEFDLLSGFLTEKVITPMSEKFADNSVSIAIASAIVLIVVAAVVIIIRKRQATKRKDPDGAEPSKIQRVINEVGAGLRTVLRMKKNGWFLFHTFFIWFLYFLMTWVCFFCLESTSHLDVKAGMFILVVGGLGMSAPVQGGIGAYHYIVSQGLQLFGISSTDGIAYATLVHTTQTLLVVVLGIFAMWMLFLAGAKQKNP